MSNEIRLEDDSKEKESLIIRRRLPWLFLGLIGGVFATMLSSRFESVLVEKIHLAFFIPIIVYMADAVGTQTEVVYVRNMGRKNVKLSTYLVKEFMLGLFIGALFGLIMGVFSYFWFKDVEASLSVGISMLLTISIAPVFALIVSTFFHNKHTDPAVTAAPFYTIIQDTITILIYFAISSFVILR